MATAELIEGKDVRRKAAPRADRRVVRTRKAVRRALIELMEERGFDGFTVNDLCARADINRGTFYNHYHDKDDLLASLEQELFDRLDSFQEQMAEMSLVTVVMLNATKQPLPLLVDLFSYLHEQGDFLHAVLGPGGDASFGPRMRDSVCTNLIECILHERYRNSDDPFVGYYVAFFSNAYLGVIMRWLETGMQESPEKMALIAMRLLFIKPGESIKL